MIILCISILTYSYPIFQWLHMHSVTPRRMRAELKQGTAIRNLLQDEFEERTYEYKCCIIISYNCY
jgi:hypothetical protein